MSGSLAGPQEHLAADGATTLCWLHIVIWLCKSWAGKKANMHSAGKIVDDPYATSKDAAGGAQKIPLTSILTLDANYFPEELFSSAEKR